MEQGDGYPERICNPCRMQLGMFFNFKVAAIRMHEMYTKTLNEVNVCEKKNEATGRKPIRGESIRKSARKRPKYQKIGFHEPLPDSQTTLIIEQCKELDIEPQQYSPTATYNIFQNDESEIENPVSEEQPFLEEDDSLNISDDGVSQDQIKKESIEMDEIYLEDEFHEPAYDNEAEEEENDEISDKIPNEDNETCEEESTESIYTVSNMKVKNTPGDGQMFRLVIFFLQ